MSSQFKNLLMPGGTREEFEYSTRKGLSIIEKSLNSRTLECSAEIEAVLAALCLRQHAVLIGPPGTAKSRIVKDACKALSGLTFFSALLTRYIEPEALTGPLSIPELQNGRYVYLSDGFLPKAQVAYLDEIFNASSAFLNTLLTLLNEREFNGEPVPLMSVIGSSNQLPEGLDTLKPDVQTSRALYDRILLRVMVQPLQTDKAWASMLLGKVDVPLTEIRLNQHGMRLIYEETHKVKVKGPAMQALLALRAELIRSGITVSDRRWRAALPLAQFRAWRDGRQEVLPKDLLLMINALWSTPDQIGKVTEAVMGVSMPALLIAKKVESELIEEVSQLRTSKVDKTQYLSKAIDLNTKLLTQISHLQTLLKDSGPVAEVTRVLRWMQGVQNEMGEAIRQQTAGSGDAGMSLGSILDELEDTPTEKSIGF